MFWGFVAKYIQPQLDVVQKLTGVFFFLVIFN